MNDYATIYLPGGAPSRSDLQKLPGIQVVSILTGADGLAAKYTLQYIDRSMVITVHNSDIEAHVCGLSSFVLSVHMRKPKTTTSALLDAIQKTKVVMGVVIPGGFDADGFIGGILTAMTTQAGGFLFARDTLFGVEGEVLVLS